MEATKNVLVCEDDPVQLRILSAMITQAGYRSLSARTPGEAVAAARRCGIDAVVADVQLQDGNAFDLVGDLRRMGLDTPVFMASSYATDGVRQRARAAGVRDFFEKPFNFSRIKSRVDAALKKPARRLDGTVVLLESHSEVRASLKKQIAEAGFRVVAAGDGSKVLRLLRSKGQAIDLLVMDLHARGTSGAELIRQALEIVPALRVVAISGDAPREEIGEAYAAGAAAYLGKPLCGDWFGGFLRSNLKSARKARKAEDERRERRATEPFLRKAVRRIASYLGASSASLRKALLQGLVVGLAALAIGASLGVALEQSFRARDEMEAFTLRMLDATALPGGAAAARRPAAPGLERMDEQLRLMRESNEFTRNYYQDYLRELRLQGRPQAAPAPAAMTPAAPSVVDFRGAGQGMLQAAGLLR